MKMKCCACCAPSPKCYKRAIFASAITFVCVGAFLVGVWGSIYDAIFKLELSLRNKHTVSYGFWKETPIPMYMNLYMYNWTNKDVILKNWNNRDYSVKPKFEELGPYVYYEHHIRENITFNDNDTISYQTKRLFYFEPSLTNGSSTDLITTFNPLIASMAYIVQDKHYLVQRAVNFLLEEKGIKYEDLAVTKTVAEFLFDGYEDVLLDLVNKLHLKGFNIPFDKFGWFYTRNGSSTYDGNFTMYTGADDLEKLGRFTLWNGKNHSDYYPSYCGMINGTSAELWYPPRGVESVYIFLPDTCSSLKLFKNGTDTRLGLTGDVYVNDASLFDNGTNYPEMACFNMPQHNRTVPSGVRNISQCKYGAPAFASLPHFHMADPIYNEMIDAPKPNPEEDIIKLALEPKTGVPLYADAKLQVNLLLVNISAIDILANVQPMMFPSVYLKETADLNKHFATLTKFMLVVPDVGLYFGYGLMGLGGVVLAIGAFVTLRKGWKDEDDEQLLTDTRL